MSLDGLVNDARYYSRVVLGGDLAGYLEEERIDWIADSVCAEESSPIASWFPIIHPESDPALVERGFEQAARFADVGSTGCRIEIWRRRALRDPSP